MKQCLNCNNENLMISKKESNFIPGAKYCVCKSCGNVMFLIDNTLIATPTNDSARTKLLIQDAADCFGEEFSFGGAVSLDGKTTPVNIQPIQTIESIQEYVRQQLKDSYEEEYYDDDEDEEYDDYIEVEMSEEDEKELQNAIEKSKKGFEPWPNYMVLLHNSGEKHLYMNTSPDFILNIINDIKEPFSLFELKHIELKTEVKYSF